MRVLGLALAALCPLVVHAPATAQTTAGSPAAYRLDAAHSRVAFSVRYLRLMTVEGRFEDWDATIVDPEDPTRGAVAIVFRAASLDTGNETRDEHLRSPDFFDAEQYPTIVFTSREVVTKGDGFVARGTLTMHGESREIEIDFAPAYAPMTDGKGNRRAGFTGETVIDREAFGIVGGNRFNAGFDPLVSIINEDVKITFAIHVMIPPIRSAAIDSLVSAVEDQGVETVVAAWHAELPRGDGEEAETGRMQMAGLYNATGYRLLQEGRVNDAVALLELSVTGAPNSARARSALAEAYARAGMREEAREAVEQALARDAREARALALRSWLQWSHRADSNR